METNTNKNTVLTEEQRSLVERIRNRKDISRKDELPILDLPVNVRKEIFEKYIFYLKRNYAYCLRDSTYKELLKRAKTDANMRELLSVYVYHSAGWIELDKALLDYPDEVRFAWLKGYVNSKPYSPIARVVKMLPKDIQEGIFDEKKFY